MNIINPKYILFYKFFFSFIFFVNISLFFSYQKIYYILIFSILYFLLNLKYQKIITVNILIIVIFLKIILIPFQKKIPELNLSKTEIYEKHYLYGVKNLNFKKNYLNGDLSNLEDDIKKKYYNKNNKEISIITDNYGFRNQILPNDANYILIGDSILYQSNITQNKILNYILNNNKKLKTYNAGLPATDISHYLETIKFFKKNKKLKDKKYIMLIFQGNDFLKYNSGDNEKYHKYIDNFLLHHYFKFKTFFNFYNTSKFLLHNIKKNNNDFKRVYEYSINKNDVLFKFDYIYNKDTKVSQIDLVFKKYENYLPDLIIFIPTKHEVYCDLINNIICERSKHFNILSNSDSIKNIKILNTTDFFIKKSKELIKLENKLLYEYDDTHLNELGVKYLSNFIYNNLKK